MSLMQQGLAWNIEADENNRLKKTILSVLPIFICLLVYVSWVDLPEQDRETLEALPPQLAKVILKKKTEPKPVIKDKKKIEKKEEKKIVPEKVAEKPKPKPKLKKPVPQIAEKPKAKIKHKPKEVLLAREKAKTSGLLAMSSQLSAMSAMASKVTLDVPQTITAKPIARKAVDRLASSVSTGRSAGVDKTLLTQDTQKIDLSARKLTEVDQVEEVYAAVEEEEKAAAEQLLVAQRTSEELRRTMDANKSAIRSIYNRALRKKPSLQGIFTPLLVIEESGEVSGCTTESSTLGEPGLESKFCKRLRLVDFGYKAGVDRMKFKYPFDLLPG
ncbi:MAG: hypothetical protein ACI84K_001142 [Pseudohongiellaceae bacterium]